jgi:hypothetical protein
MMKRTVLVEDECLLFVKGGGAHSEMVQTLPFARLPATTVQQGPSIRVFFLFEESHGVSF